MPQKLFVDGTPIIVNTAAGGTLQLVAAVARQRVGLMKMFLVMGGATNISFAGSVSGALTGPMPFTTNGSLVLDVPINGEPWVVTAPGEALQLVMSAAVQVSGLIYTLQGP